MTAQTSNQSYFDKCRCCLKTGRYKDMWNAFIHDGRRETYGAMLAECFAITLQQPADHYEQICGACVKRLLDAFNFKKLVLASEKLILQLSNGLKTQVINEHKDNGQKNIFKEDENTKGDSTEHEKSSKGDMDMVDGSDIEKECLEDYNSSTMEQNDMDGTQYLEVQFLDDDKVAAEEEKGEPSKPGKAPKRKKNCGRLKKLMYTDDELREAMEAVKNKTMTRAQASVYYNISLKNLRWKLREANIVEGRGVRPIRNTTQTQSTAAQSTPDSTVTVKIEPIEATPKPKAVKAKELSEKETLNRKNYNNIRMILLSSNATPIQGYHGKGYNCCFCPEQFLKTADLKTHTLESHKEDKSEYMKTKDAWEFCVKLDITGLRCELCAKEIESLDTLISHLIKEHELKIFLDAVQQIIPFRFNHDVLSCAICGDEFLYFKLLSQHMNEHYKNFMCKICERWFVNKSSLRTHEYRHQYGEFRCTYCRKEFTTAIRKRDHERAVHRMNCRTHKCGYCDEKFADAAGRYKHETDAHGLEPRVFKCKACDISFTRQGSLTDHLNGYHLLIKQHECAICNKTFVRRKTLKRHMLIHTGVKEFICHVCQKEFARKSGLIQHLRIHEDDRRYKCDHCGSGFVQRVTLKHHLRAKHGVTEIPAASSSVNNVMQQTFDVENAAFSCDISYETQQL